MSTTHWTREMEHADLLQRAAQISGLPILTASQAARRGKVWRAQILIGAHVAREREFKRLFAAKLWRRFAGWRVELRGPYAACSHGCCHLGIYWRIGRVDEIERPVLLRAAYVELLSSRWPRRASLEGQRVLCDLRDELARLTGASSQSVQESCEEEAALKSEALSGRKPEA